ncbi:Protein kinase domain [Trypanosoma melophagium]|uniref:Protein kinase domain n=1 Tax=Trypanosoma melophagium TaxID=715481 RepID=UPI00351A189C|nr:Protein kinase domain [Trypanosoma melophagium]
MRANDIVKGRYSTYQLQDLIGKGGNAVVHSAIDRSTGAIVAVKKMTARDDTVMATWRKEVAIISSLEHPYIIRYIDHTRSGKDFIIVTEYAPGGSLLQQLKRNGHYGEREVARLMFQITSGLAYIHENKFLHRDLKCANVLLGTGDIVKLSDFGLAMPHGFMRGDENDSSGGEDEPQNRAVSLATAAAVAGEEGMVGSVYWMAPETIRGEPQNESSDIWSLGCLCIELLTGNPPFYDRAPVNALYHIAESDEVPMPTMELSEECRTFLTHCLNRDRTKRMSAAALLRLPWFGGFVAENILETLANAQTADINVDQVSNSTAIARWVESNLFHERAEQREQWLRAGCLKKVVAVLPKVTADASFQIIRSFAFASQRGHMEPSCFLSQLGDTDLWDNERLDVLGKVDSLCSLFVSCCERQDPRVPQYAPTHPGALYFLLQCTEGNIAIPCIDALRNLLVGGDEDEGTYTNSLSQEVLPVEASKITYRRFISQNRFVSDKAFYAVQRIIEDICCKAFQEEKEPAIGWTNVDKLFEMLLQVFKKNGNECIIMGPSAAALQNAEGVESSTTLSVTAGETGSVRAEVGARTVVGGNANNNTTTNNTGSITNGNTTTTTSTTSTAGAVGVVGNTSVVLAESASVCPSTTTTTTTTTAAAAAVGVIGTTANTTSMTTPTASSTNATAAEDGGVRVNLTHGGVNSNNNNNNNNSVGVCNTRQGEERWLLALQEASRHLCSNAILLLLQYIDYARRHNLKCLNLCGKSIAGTFLIVASDAAIDPPTRMALLKCLPLLQRASQRAAGFLRDTRCSLPLLAHTVLNLHATADGREDDVLKVLHTICEDDAVAAALAANNALVATVVERAAAAAARRKWPEVLVALWLLEVLFAHAKEPGRVVESRGFPQLLLRLVGEENCSANLKTVAQRLLNGLQTQTNVL